MLLLEDILFRCKLTKRISLINSVRQSGRTGGERGGGKRREVRNDVPTVENSLMNAALGDKRENKLSLQRNLHL